MHFVDGTFSAEGVCMNCNNHMTGSLPVHTMYTTDRPILKNTDPSMTRTRFWLSSAATVSSLNAMSRRVPPYFLTPAHQQAILNVSMISHGNVHRSVFMSS